MSNWLKAWRCFLYGAATPIDIYTDHHSLQWINTQPNLSARQSRWVEQLQDYAFNYGSVDSRYGEVKHDPKPAAYRDNDG